MIAVVFSLNITHVGRHMLEIPNKSFINHPFLIAST